MDSVLFSNGWELSPFLVEWDGKHWGGNGALKDSIAYVSRSMGDYDTTTYQYNISMPPPLFCSADSIKGIFFISGNFAIGEASGAIGLRLTEPLEKDSFYRLPLVYAHDGTGRGTHTVRRYDSLKFNFSVYTSDTSEVYRENHTKYAVWFDIDTIGNYEFIERVPYAISGKWQRYWLEFTATAAQDGHDWLLYSVNCRSFRT